MKHKIALLLLICATICLGIWTWRTANHREFNVLFGAKGDEALQWGEKAEHDRWVEIVTVEIIDGNVEYVPVPNRDIDAYIRSKSNIIVQRWLPNDQALGVLGTLANDGYSSLRELTGKTSEFSLSQKAKARWLTAATILVGLIALSYGIILKRLSKVDKVDKVLPDTIIDNGD